MDIPNRLVESINNGQCAIFVGSGISSRLYTKHGKRYPNWSELVEQLNMWAKENDLITAKEFELISNMIIKGNYIMSAQILEDRMTETELGNFLETVFRNDCQFDYIHDLIFDIPFSLCMTTNYDLILENAYMYKFSKNLPAFTPDQYGMVNDYVSNKKFFLFKLHGTYERSESIVFTKDDYRKMGHWDAYTESLKNIFLTKNVLFVGFSYSDPDIEAIVSELAYDFNAENRMHYLLIQRGQYNELEHKYMKEKDRISVIEYENEDGMHLGVDSFFRELSNKTKKK